MHVRGNITCRSRIPKFMAVDASCYTVLVSLTPSYALASSCSHQSPTAHKRQETKHVTKAERVRHSVFKALCRG